MKKCEKCSKPIREEDLYVGILYPKPNPKSRIIDEFYGRGKGKEHYFHKMCVGPTFAS